MKKFSLLCAAAVLAMPVAAYAQQITTEISGQVTNAEGQPLSNAQVIVTDTRTGATSTSTTGSDGLFVARNLATGGPYTVTATAQGFQGQTVEQVNTTLQGATQLTFSLATVAAETTSDTIVVTGARARVTTLSNGPGTSFGADFMANAPTFERDVRDVIRLDPRVSLSRDDLSGQDRVSCLGGNDRGNAFTVDGILQGDIYGLNETGFSARTSTPLPYDAVRETQVNFAPFDVEYGQFTGCAINVVTRGGTNRLSGSAFFEVTGDDFSGTKAKDSKISFPDYRDKRWGASLGVPIIKDQLFLFGAYEERKSSNTVEAGVTGGGYGIEIPALTKTDFDTFTQILRDTYGIDTGGLPQSLPFSNKRWFLRGDWQINENHRLEATWQKIKENAVETDDTFTTGSSPQVSGNTTAMAKGSDGQFYSLRFYSKWNDLLSTELRYAHSKTVDVQDPQGGFEAQGDNPTPRIIVGVRQPNGSGGYNYGAFLAGPGTSRSANDLRTWIDQWKGAAKLNLGAHQVKLGAELNKAHIYNLFVSNATGTLVFQNLNDLAAGLLSRGTGSNSTSTSTSTNIYNGVTEGAFGNFTASGDINDAAADFRRTVTTLYAQDDWRVTDRLDVTLGLRYDMFSGDSPAINAKYIERYGIRNDVGFNDIPSILLPRLSATYSLGDFAVFSSPKIRGGLGVFSGGDPLVWFGNAFQNDGSTFGFASSQAAGCPAAPTQIDVVTGGNFTGVPQCVINAAALDASSGNARVNSVDPDIKMTTVWRANLGFESRLNFGSGLLSDWRFNADFIYSRYKNPFTIVDLAQAVNPALGVNGYTIDGRPIYRGIDLLLAGCNATLVEINPTPVYDGITSQCFTSNRDDELMLTNAGSYDSKIYSVLLSKNIRHGLVTSGGNIFFNLGYSYADVEDRRNMYNSTAGSNYDNVAAFDRQNPEATRGFYSQKHNFTASTTFRERFFGDNDTTLGFTFTARSGRPYSLTFTGGSDFNVFNSGSDNALAYIPTGPADPNLSPSSNPTEVAEYLAFLKTIKCDDDYRGETIERNSCSNDWYYDMDVRFSQELPGPGSLLGRNDKIELYAMMDNFLNFLDKDWNVFRRRQFSGYQDVVDLSSAGVDSQGRYIISSFTGDTFDTDNQIKFSSSLWRLKIGIGYKF